MSASTLSAKGLGMIAGFEGYRRYPYNDVADNATIGYGHLLHLGPVSAADHLRYPLGLTVREGLTVLRSDCAHAEAAVRTYVKRELGQGQYDALVSFTFNCGGGALAHSTLLVDVNRDLGAKGALTIATDFMRWDHAGGVVVPGLRTRRHDEAVLFLQGRYPEDT